MAAITVSFKRNHRVNFDRLKDATLSVGWFGGIRYEDGTPVARVAEWNEFGAIAGGKYKIPARPFMRPVAHGKASQINSAANVIFKTGIINNQSAEKMLGQLAELVIELIQQQIDATVLPQNSPVTLHGGWLKTSGGIPFHVDKKRGRHPLINTGFMRDSIDYQVEVNGD